MNRYLYSLDGALIYPTARLVGIRQACVIGASSEASEAPPESRGPGWRFPDGEVRWTVKKK
jgi:hypothetical protein